MRDHVATARGDRVHDEGSHPAAARERLALLAIAAVPVLWLVLA